MKAAEPRPGAEFLDRVTRDVRPDPRPPRQIAAQFGRLLEQDHVLRPAGAARDDPGRLLRAGYTPRFRVDLFETRIYLTALRREDQFRFFVAYVRPARPPARGACPIFPRIMYKDSSLVWRTASHLVVGPQERWIGKGAVKPVPGDPDLFASAEETTNLPFECQAALDDISRRGGPARPDRRAVDWVLRRAPPGRIEPYADFSRPRAGLEHAVNGGRDVAWFDDPLRPESLQFAEGYAPDFRRGTVAESVSRSSLYGGDIVKRRFVSGNGEVQYVVVAGPHQVWFLPPQTLTRELTTYGLRPVDVPCAEELCLPGYEFHYPGHSQIPHGFAGAASEIDPSRADTSPWNDRLPILREFRRLFGA